MRAAEFVSEKWSAKYKRSINCSNPKGFSQRAHCAGRRKNEDVAEGYSLGKVLTLPELLDQIKHILAAKHRGIGWRMTMPAENTFLFSARNDYDVWSMLVVEPGGDDWVAVGHGMVDPDGKPIIFDRQQLPMTLASASEIADEAIQTYHDIDLSDYADDEDYNQGVAEEQLDELTFKGSPCTKDCSGHRAGYEWSRRKGGVDAASWSRSFNNGAALFKNGY